MTGFYRIIWKGCGFYLLLLTIYMKGVWHILGINATTIVICVLFAIFLPHIGMVIRCSLPIIIMIFIFLLIITIATIVIYVIGMVISTCIII